MAAIASDTLFRYRHFVDLTHSSAICYKVVSRDGPRLAVIPSGARDLTVEANVTLGKQRSPSAF